MNVLFLYLAKSALCIAVLYLVYRIFFRGVTFFILNRIYLVGMIAFSLLMPLIPLHWTPSGPGQTLAILLDPVIITTEKMDQAAEQYPAVTELVAGIYFAGMLFFLVRFLFMVARLLVIIVVNGIRQQDGHRVVITGRGNPPFSFFNLIFLGQKELPKDRYNAIISHEYLHIRQRHTIDRLLAEILSVVQWFNPMAWLAGRDLISVHEFLADEGVLQSGISRPLYQQLILDESMGFRGNRLTHHFNVSLLKKRILMISKQKSGNWAKARYLFILPALFALLFLLSVPTFSSAFLDNVKTGFGIPSVPGEPGAMIQDKAPQGKTAKKDSCNAAVVKPGEEVYKVVEKMPEFQGGMKALQEFLLKNIKYPEAAKKKQTQGTVFVAFVVGKDGTIGNVKVIRGIGNGCDEEAVRVVKLMPKWIPGEEKGKPVNVVFNIPIKFMLGDKKKEEQKEKQ